MVICSLDNNFFFNLGLSAYEEFFMSCGIEKVCVIDFHAKNFKQAIDFLEENNFPFIVLFCKSFNSLYLAFFLKRKYKNIAVWCGYKEMMYSNIGSVRYNCEYHRIDSKIVLVKEFKKTLSHIEFDLLCSLVNGEIISSYTGKYNVTNQTFYKHRKSLMQKLKLSKFSFY